MGWIGALVLLVALATYDAVAAAPAPVTAHRPHAAGFQFPAPTLAPPLATEAVSAPAPVTRDETCTPTMAGSNWSPDGAWFAFECRISPDAQPHLQLARADGTQVWRYDVNWQTLEAAGQSVTGAILPFHWSKNGRWVYAALSADRDDGACGVYGKGQTVVRVELSTGKGQVLLQGTPAFARFEAAVSPDDRYFMYALNGARQFDPRVMDLQTGEIVTYALDEAVGQVGQSTWSPDGAHLVALTATEFCRTQTNDYQLAILDQAAREARQVTLPVPATAFVPVRWRDATTLELWCECTGPDDRWALDVVSGQITAQP
jgi:Tol biopolymer transport system component